MLWGNRSFQWLHQPSSGYSGGILCSWLEGACLVTSHFSGVGFLGTSAVVRNKVVHVVNIYAPCSTGARRRVMAELVDVKPNLGVEEWCIVGDFNAVSSSYERRGRSVSTSQVELDDFNSFIVDMDLVDVPVSGKKFSWFCSDGISMSRLDRFLISEGLMADWGITGQWIGNRDISDHSPIWLLRSSNDWGPKPFRFFNAWLSHDDFLPFVQSCWNGFSNTGNKAFVLKEKLKSLKGSIRSWNKEVFGKVDLNIDILVRDLNSLDDMLCEGWDSDVVANRREVSASLWKEIRAKESFLAQKSRARWIKEGDMNSKYFHSLMRYRRRRCNVVILRDNGEQLEEVDAVKLFVKQHFEKCFSEANHNRPLLGGLQFKRLTSAHADSLVQPFTEEEIRMGVWECDGDKSPGPDGFNLNFVKSGWSFMKEDVVGFFNEFYANAFLPKAISASFIALVPKNDNPQGLGEFRPICLIGCIYKILAKVLASRLKKVMPSIISHHQSAFIGGGKFLTV